MHDELHEIFDEYNREYDEYEQEYELDYHSVWIYGLVETPFVCLQSILT